MSIEDGQHDRQKHIHIRYHFLKDCVKNHLVSLHHIPGTEQVADILTKGLAFPQFEKLCNVLLGQSSSDLPGLVSDILSVNHLSSWSDGG